MNSNDSPAAGKTTTAATLQNDPANGPLWSWVSPAADVVTLIGFGITVWVLIQTFRLRKDFASRARVPDIRKSLEHEGSELVRCLDVWPAKSREAMASLSRTRGILGNLSKKLDGDNRALTRKLMRSLDRKRFAFFGQKRAPLDVDTAWRHYADIQQLIAALEQHEKDYVWK
jgi:hypothetical protein